MDAYTIDPVKKYEYQQLVDKSTRVNKSNSQDEFIDIIIEQIFLNKIVNSNSFLDEDENNQNEPDDIITFSKNKSMDEYNRSNIMSQIAADDTFGLREAFKKRGFVNDK